ncbi:MAG: hypothetical protein V3T83_09640 [Acidobacteriota bacterium]
MEILILASLLFSWAFQAPTPPTGVIEGRVGKNTEGTQENPFTGALGISLFLRIVDDTPSSYETGGWQVFPTGSFCPGPFQFFGTERVTPTLKHPRVSRGTARVRITALIREPPFDLVKAEAIFFIAAGPGGCGSPPPPVEGIPIGLGIEIPASGVTGETVNIGAKARARRSSQLVFLFSAATSAGQAGIIIGEAAASGDCRSASRSRA